MFSTGSCSATTVAGSAALPFVISTGAQRSGEICVFSGLLLELCFRLGSCTATTVAGSAALPFVISTGAQRSGEICVFSGLFLEMCFRQDPVQQLQLQEARPSPLSSRPERSVVERSAFSAVSSWNYVFDRVLFSNYSCRKRGPPLCHLDRSAAYWRDLRFQRSLLGTMFSTGSCSATTVAGSAALPFVISTGAQRSGEICVFSGLFLKMCFRQGPVQQLQLQEARPSPFVISTGAQRSGEICVFSGLFLELCFRQG